MLLLLVLVKKSIQVSVFNFDPRIPKESVDMNFPSSPTILGKPMASKNQREKDKQKGRQHFGLSKEKVVDTYLLNNHGKVLQQAKNLSTI